jgi:hypothetical protein
LITYKPDIVGDFPEDFPEGAFKIKTGGQVMFVKMICQWTRIISTEKWSHKISFESGNLFIFLKNKTIEVENTNGRIFDIKLILQTEIEEEVLGTFVHYPISWLGQLRCIKGIDFDKAAIDVSQVLCQVRHVALSRLRSLEGLILLSPLRMGFLTIKM